MVEVEPGMDARVRSGGVGVEGDGLESRGLWNTEIELYKSVGVGSGVVLTDRELGEQEDVGAHALDDLGDLLQSGVV